MVWVAFVVVVLLLLDTPLSALFNNVETGDIELPWASIAGFVDVAIVTGIASPSPVVTNAAAPTRETVGARADRIPTVHRWKPRKAERDV